MLKKSKANPLCMVRCKGDFAERNVMEELQQTKN